MNLLLKRKINGYKMNCRYKYNEFTKIPEMPNSLLLYLDVCIMFQFFMFRILHLMQRNN